MASSADSQYSPVIIQNRAAENDFILSVVIHVGNRKAVIPCTV